MESFGYYYYMITRRRENECKREAKYLHSLPKEGRPDGSEGRRIHARHGILLASGPSRFIWQPHRSSDAEAACLGSTAIPSHPISGIFGMILNSDRQQHTHTCHCHCHACKNLISLLVCSTTPSLSLNSSGWQRSRVLDLFQPCARFRPHKDILPFGYHSRKISLFCGEMHKLY